MTALVIAVSLAILISAGCSLFEAVLYSVPTRHIEAMAQAGKSSGKIFKKMKRDVERPITAILSLNTIAHTAGAAVAGSAAAMVFGQQWLGYFAVFFTVAILVFSEIIPKTAGVVYGRTLVSVVAHPLKGLVWIMAPAIWLSSHLTRLIAQDKTEDSVTAEELRVMARLSLQTGGIMPYQEKIIESILTLQNKRVKDVMTPRTVAFSLSEHLSLKETKKKVARWEHSRFPVYDEDMEDVVGIVLTKELFMALSQGKEDMHLTDLMRPVHFVVDTAPLNRVLMEFLESRQHLFVVLDEYGGLSGLVSLEDILEEILGREIVDESDMVADKRTLARLRRKRL
ncbi:MAG: HlyC/CorC family transporter, partial [Deltaproteobacteria bacterium]|nr:HlyC/CorC family transporter [Deltaproteobacteria bacterium]